MASLTETAFELLLKRLGSNENESAENYEELRLKTFKFLTYKGCPESVADELVDETFNTVAQELEKGTIVDNINGFTKTVAFRLSVKYFNKHIKDNKAVVFDPSKPENIESALNKSNTFTMPDVLIEPDEPDRRLECLRKCLQEIPNEKDRQLALDYYSADEGEKNKNQRKSLAERLGITYINLKTKASRLRDRLEKCIIDCMKSVK